MSARDDQSADVVLYGRAGCCLCDEAENLLLTLRPEFDFTLHKIDIDTDSVLLSTFRCQIPVVTIDGGNRVALRVTRERLIRAFHQARRRAATCQEMEA